MSNRALVVRRERDEYECYRTQWVETDRLVETAIRGQCPVTENGESPRGRQWDRCGRAKWPKLVDNLDYLSLDLCIRCDPGAVRAYLPVWLGIPTGDCDETASDCGALLHVESRLEFTRLRERVRRHKARLGNAIENGEVGRRAAQRSLLVVVGSRERQLSASAERCFVPSG